MAHMKVINIKQLPARPPYALTLGLVACLKAFGATSTIWAVAITLLTILWIVGIITVVNQEFVDIDL